MVFFRIILSGDVKAVSVPKVSYKQCEIDRESVTDEVFLTPKLYFTMVLKRLEKLGRFRF